VTAAPAAYVRSIRDLFLRLPITANRFNPSDRLLALDLHRRAVPLDVVRAAFLLAAARKLARNPCAPIPLPVRSLHYFLPVIAEIQSSPLSPRYLEYLESKLR
jgi:hypothetical protein